MKFIKEFRDPGRCALLAEKINSLRLKPMRIMEVCGSHTHTIMRYGIEDLLPGEIELVHGPGCPVCVTPPELIDQAIGFAEQKEFAVVTYGDMLRVPGSGRSLLNAKASGADVRIIYSPLDVVAAAKAEPGKNFVFFAIGFETTAPANANAALIAKEAGLKNIFILSAHVLIPPAVEYLLSSGKLELDALLAPGHVCAVTGYRWCEEISTRFNIPIVVTGFEPADLLEGIYLAAQLVVNKEYKAINQYSRVVTRTGNRNAQEILNKVLMRVDRNWRGLGEIKNSGLDLRNEYSDFDAQKVFGVISNVGYKKPECIAGEILQGLSKPVDCKYYGSTCTPDNPIGAPMVSSEGACAAYFKYKKN